MVYIFKLCLKKRLPLEAPVKFHCKIREINTLNCYLMPNVDEKHLVEISRRVAKGAIQPTIDNVHEVADTANTFERSLSGRARGKIVIHVCDE